MKKKIVILGATEYVNPLILKASDLGFETHVFAWEKGDIGEKTADFFYPISITNLEAMLEKCKEIQPNGIVSLGSDLAAYASAYVAEKLRLPGNSPDSIRNAVNKLNFRRLMGANDILQPRFVGIGDEYPKSDNKNIHFPVVVKPSDRSASRGVKKILNMTDLFNGIAQAREISVEGKVIVEEYIYGRHFSCECMSVNGVHHILAYTKRDNIESYSMFIEHIQSQPAYLTDSQRKRVEEIVKKVLDILEIRLGASCVEFFLGANEEVIILEVTPSMYGDFIGTDLVELTTGYDYMRMILQASLDNEVDFRRDSKGNLKATARVQIILSKDDVQQLEERKIKRPGSMVKYKYFTAKEMIPDRIDGGRYGYFIYFDDPE